MLKNEREANDEYRSVRPEYSEENARPKKGLSSPFRVSTVSLFANFVRWIECKTRTYFGWIFRINREANMQNDFFQLRSVGSREPQTSHVEIKVQAKRGCLIEVIFLILLTAQFNFYRFLFAKFSIQGFNRNYSLSWVLFQTKVLWKCFSNILKVK